MLNETKLALRVTVNNYDAELASLLMAGAGDLRVSGVVIPGDVTFTAAQDGTVIDLCTVTDALVKRALITYAAARFGNPPNYDRLKDAYDEMKATLKNATGYTDWGGDTE